MGEFNAYVGAKLRKLRRLRGLSQAALATLVGVSFQQIQKYEAGVNALSLERACRIAEALQTSVADLCEGHATQSHTADQGGRG